MLEKKPESIGHDSLKARVDAFLEAFSSGDIDGLAAMMNFNAKWWVSGGIVGMSGTYTRDQLADLLRQIKPAYVGGALRITPVSMIAEGNKVAVEAESYGELTNGRVYRNRYHFLFTFEDGQILEVKEYMDTMHAWETFIRE